MTPRRLLLVALLAVGLVAAGCVKKDEPTPDGATTTTPPTGGPPGGGSTNSSSSSSTQNDKGTIQGPFSKEWTLSVPLVSPKAVVIHFNLTGVQAGAPPTARVNLQLLDPDGKVVKSAIAGVGGSNAIAWTLSAADVTAVGDYKLRAASDAATPAGVPSGGVGNYDLHTAVEY